jgi:hypothetical protein
MRGRSIVVRIKHIFIEKCNKATYKNENNYLLLYHYESYEALTRKHLVCGVV